MKRSEFLKQLAVLGLGVTGIDALLRAANALPMAEGAMPALFIGHGTPANILGDNAFTQGWAAIGAQLPRPKAILVISAHWLTRGTFVSSTAKPATISDFFGYPDELYNVKYAVPGSPGGAKLVQETLVKSGCQLEGGRGLDHGAWMVLRHMYPLADIPTFQMSIDRTREPEGCFKLGKALRLLRAKGILVIGSGNITHNLGKMAADEAAAPEEWAEEFDVRVKNLLERGDLIALTQFGTWGKVAELALPSHDHYLPLLFAAGLRQDDEPIKTVLEGFTFGTLSMRSVQFG